MTTLHPSNELATQPRNLFRWLELWLSGSHKPARAKNIPFENETERNYHLDSQGEIARHLAERSTRCL